MDGCRAAAARQDLCLAHLSTDELAALLRDVAEGHPLIARDAHLNEDLFHAIRTTLVDVAGFTLHDADFAGATFSGHVDFEDFIFYGNTSFDRAHFQESVTFHASTFQGSDNQKASFAASTFASHSIFSGCTFDVDALFRGASFGGRAIFALSEFSRLAAFEESWFTHVGDFQAVECAESLTFDETTFERDALFEDAHVRGAIRFNSCRFRASVDTEGATGGRIQFDDAAFSASTRLKLAFEIQTFRATTFERSADIRIDEGDVVLEGARFGAPSVVTGAEAEVVETTEAESPRVRLLSLRRTDVTNLTLARLDLRPCLFAGAHHLDHLKTEAVLLPSTPKGWHVGFALPPLWHWTSRIALAEEHAWRARSKKSHGWLPPECTANFSSDFPVHIAGTRRIEEIYRALRKGREDPKDEPGAADFYYGEMEMRRARQRFGESSPDAPGTAERVIVSLYWLVSGYGLRAWRASLGFALLILGTSFFFGSWGLCVPTPFLTTAIDALETATGFQSGFPPENLTAVGEVGRVVVRVTGPALLALAILAIRGRTKR